MKRKNLSVRTRTRVSQQADHVTNAEKKSYCQRVMTTFHNRINNPHLFDNMDETAIHLNCSTNHTVKRKADRTVSIRLGGSFSSQFTLAVTIAINGLKLPPFVIFKVNPGGTIEKSLPDILPDGVFGCVQFKG